MSYVLKTNLARRDNYGNSRTAADVKYICIHYTANDGDHDESNANYFHNNKVSASAHYFVDDDSITISVPELYVAWSVGGNKWNDCASTGGGKLYKVANNTNTINIEMCDTVRDGKYSVSEKTLENTISLIKTLMEKYHIDINHVIRHFDVNGKHCPVYYMDESKWKEFKNKIVKNNNTTSIPELNGESSSSVFSPYVVKVKIANLNVRKGPGTEYGKNGYCPIGSYTIVEVKQGKGSKKGWGKLKSGIGWISLDYVE